MTEKKPTAPTMTPEQMRVYLTSNELNFILAIVEFHNEAVTENLKLMGFHFLNAQAVDNKIKSLYENEEFDLLFKAIDVELTFDTMQGEYKEVVQNIINNR